MAIFQQRRAVLVFGKDAKPMVRVRHQAAPVRGKPCIGVVGFLGVFGKIEQLRGLRGSAVHDIVEPVGKGESHLGLQKRGLAGDREWSNSWFFCVRRQEALAGSCSHQGIV